MAKLIGYGEDSLTLWALTKNYAKFKEKFKENLDEATIFYRPSFGRGGRSDKNFGEFDAVIVSSEKVYFIESKWDHSSEIKKGTKKIVLREEQKIRFDILREYLKVWPKIVCVKNGKKVIEENNEYNSLKNFLDEKLIQVLSVRDTDSTLFSNIDKIAEIIEEKKIDCFDNSKFVNLVLYFHFKEDNEDYKVFDTKGDELKINVIKLSYKENEKDEDGFVDLAKM